MIVYTTQKVSNLRSLAGKAWLVLGSDIAWESRVL